MSSTPDTIVLGTASFRVEVLSLPVRGEDAHLVRDGFAGVADGAGVVVPGAPSPAALARDSLAAIAGQGHREAVEAVRAAIERFAGPERGPAVPAAALVFARSRDEVLEVGVLSDCLGVVRRRDGSWLATPRDEVHAAIDENILARIGAAVAAGTRHADALEAEAEAIRDGRAAGNTEGGYWWFANDPAAADHLGHFSLPLDEVESVLLCSDGFARLWDTFHLVRDPGDLAAWACEHGLARLGETLRTIEAAPGAHAWAPRFADHDDTTALLLVREDRS